MTRRGLRAEFEHVALKVGPALVFEERHALALIRRAEEEYVAITGVDRDLYGSLQ